MKSESPGPVRAHGLVFDVAGASGQGPRPENQDAFSVSAFPSSGILAVADGMGGQRAGRVAADTALQAVLRVGRVQSLDAARYAVRAADEAVAHAAGADPQDRQGMGCALAVMALSPDRGGELGWVAASVGDVRILSRSPDGTVRLETRDHTPAYARWEAGEIAFDEIPDSPGANRLQRAVGHGGEADTTWIPVRAGWTYLLHSDGVTKTMRLDELGQAMALPSAAAAVEAVVAKVEERGPDDNFTAVVVRVLGDDGTSTQESPTLAAPRPYTSVPHQDSTVERPARATTFNPPDDVTPNRRSPLAGVAAALAVLALALAGYAAFAASRGSSADLQAARAEIAALRGSVDSLRARVPPDTTGRLPVSASDSGIMVVPPPAPPAAAPPAAAPAGRPR
ncbi:MAG TPA: protein phosphatase 2C domain-containing protein [Longimicrobium sp.]|nr:protein phosphatase 2C domain-containing protein [Longimicrobium sp.]